MLRRFLNIVITLALALGIPSMAMAQDSGPAVPGVDVSDLKVNAEDIVEIAPELRDLTGEVEVVVRMKDAALSELFVAEQVARQGRSQREHRAALDKKQDALVGQVQRLGGQPLARLTKAINAVVIRVDASQLDAIAKLPNVQGIRPLGRYQLDLSETVPYIGAKAVQDMGFDGTGVDVAVLDSGIDYLHYNLGGSGSVDEYNANDPNIIEPGTFPTWKVVGGYDFVGNVWPNGPLAPDPDPLDYGPGAGHGTHVADIIAGKSLDGSHVGVAPGANLYAVKVCSSVSTSCSGVALLQGMEFALDPNGDDDLSDHVDVINMSLGSSYGQRQDDLSAASANAVKMGVVVVASAGNSADKPYIVGSPSSTPEVISVAQTQVPSAKLYLIQAGGVTVGGSWQPWSAAPVYVSGPLQYGNGAGGNLNGCAAFAPGSLTGKVVLVDRGTCAISIKVSNVAAGGGLSAVIANNAAQAPGDLPPDFSFGGGVPSVPGYSITRADGMLLKGVVGQTAVIDPASAASLVMNMVSSSSRGPNVSFNQIKPDVGAPGASLSAQYGTGTGQTAFGGTSGAAPMVSGAVALMLQAQPSLTPAEVKAKLMNTAETNIGINPVGLPGYMAPITRIGGGEVRVDQAIAAQTAAWDQETMAGSMSFGYHSVSTPTTLKRTLVVKNYSNTRRQYRITPSFRYADDEASGAVRIVAPAVVVVPANGTASVPVQVKIDPSKLPEWALNGGLAGGSGYLLDKFEYDGYIELADDAETIHVAWQVLPHRSATTQASSGVTYLKKGVGLIRLFNVASPLDGAGDIFALTGVSGQIPASELPGDGDNFAVIDLKSVGVRVFSDVIQFGISTYGARAHPNYPAEFDVYIDKDMDGIPDFVLYNTELNGFGATGTNVVYVYNLATGSAVPYYYIDADLNSGNAIMTAPLAAMGMTPDTQFSFSVYAFDNYFTGALTDAIEGMTFTGAKPKYAADAAEFVVPANKTLNVKITSVPGGEAASPSQIGFLLLYRDVNSLIESQEVFVK